MDLAFIASLHCVSLITSGYYTTVNRKRRNTSAATHKSRPKRSATVRHKRVNHRSIVRLRRSLRLSGSNEARRLTRELHRVTCLWESRVSTRIAVAYIYCTLQFAVTMVRINDRRDRRYDARNAILVNLMKAVARFEEIQVSPLYPYRLRKQC